MKLTKAAGCIDKKLEFGDFHKRHFVLMAVIEALWAFCFEQLEEHGEVCQLNPCVNRISLMVMTT